jgi:peptidyl-prolyl cis-trans isomerase D
MAKGATSKIFVWILLALLIVGLAGFGATSLSGNARSIGAVGDEKITIQEYARALQDEIRAIQAQTGQTITFEQAVAFGLDRSVLGRLIGAAALDHEARAIGLSLGDENLRRQIIEVPSFQGGNGQFDREAYRFALNQAGLTEAEFEAEMRADATRSLLQGALITGVTMPAAYSDTLLGYFAERRNFTWAVLDRSALTAPIPAAPPEQLAAYHQDNAAAFTSPALKQLTYVWLSPDMVIDQVDVDEAAIREQYDDNLETYMRPERRLVERLVFSDDEAALAAKAKLETGETQFETLVQDRGLDLSDVDLGDVTKDELGAAGGAVFNAQVGDVVGPFESSLGPALFRVNAVLAAKETPYEDARDAIRTELAADRARRMVEGQSEAIDDLLAGGATLEELVTEAGMQLATMDWHDDAEDRINGYAAFRNAAEAVTEGDYPELIRLDDGGLAALRLEAEVAPALKPLDEVREEVAAAWLEAETTKALAARADEVVQELSADADMAALGLTARVETAVTRNEFISGAPSGFLAQIFEMAKGDVQVISDAATVTIVQLTDILDPDMDDPEVSALAASLAQEINASLAQDLYAAYARNIQDTAGITLDQAAINAVHANFQ